MTCQLVSSPEVDLIFLAEDPLVFASQVRHTQKFLQKRKDIIGRKADIQTTN